jgi:alginate O-acetyltransferase complex protein AlgJ
MLRIKLVLTLITVLLVNPAAAATPLATAARNLADSAGRGVVEGVDGWLFLKEELNHLAAGRFWGESAATASRSTNPATADPLPAILHYQRQLAEKGITLYLMPVPPKALIYPDKLQAGLAATEEDLGLYREFYRELAENGVEVIDLLPDLLGRRDESALYCRTDSHFSGAGLELFADAAAAVIMAEPWYGDVDQAVFHRSVESVTINGDLSQMAGGEGTGEELALTVVTRGDSQPLTSDLTSPVILLGDSHTLVFHAGGDLHARGAGLFEHLSARLGFPVDLLGVRGSGITPARVNLYQRSRQDGNYLLGKKALIWCFAARDFTGASGWREIPIAP